MLNVSLYVFKLQRSYIYKPTFRVFSSMFLIVSLSLQNVAWGMGAFLDKPKTEKYNAHGEGNGLRFGLSSMQGWRVEMEDAHTAAVGLPHGLDDWSFFAVYDGHAGSRVANYCSKHLLEHIVAVGSADELRKAGAPAPETPAIEAVKRGIRAGFLKIDEHMRSFTDLRNGMDRSGSTAVAVLLSPEHLYFINCGDSRALLCRNAHVCFSTLDHKPCDPREKERIQNAGGSVMIQRVNGSLAVSRALGDYDYKCVEGKGPTEQLVSPEPEVFEIARSDAEDEFVVLACDGIWDVMSNEELCAFVRSRLEVTDDLERVCNEVVNTCLHKVQFLTLTSVTAFYIAWLFLSSGEIISVFLLSFSLLGKSR